LKVEQRVGGFTQGEAQDERRRPDHGGSVEHSPQLAGESRHRDRLGRREVDRTGELVRGGKEEQPDHVSQVNPRPPLSPVAYGRYTANLGAFTDALDRVDTYLQGGLGFTWWDVDRPARAGGDDDDAEFLINFGFGAEYRLTEHVSAGTHMLFNVIPDEIYDERFYFSWEVVTLRYRF
jgi:opacity protein-like surface antigen